MDLALKYKDTNRSKEDFKPVSDLKSDGTIANTIELSPSYKLPLGIIIIALVLIPLQIWLGLVLALLGFFLLFQTTSIRLKFTDVALEVCRGEKLLRNFPYSDWIYWEIYWDKVPILFYFKEVKSIHFLPILFSPTTLKSCLEAKCPRQELGNKESIDSNPASE